MNPMQFRSTVFWVAVAVCLSLAACQSEPPHCAVCDREIHQGMQAKLMVEGKVQSTCCVACGVHFQTTNKTAAFRTVTDYGSGKEIDAADAVYLYNSTINTCGGELRAVRSDHTVAYACFDRCRPSVLAFQNRPDAIAVKKQHGGTVVSMTELRRLFEKQHSTVH